MGKRASKKKSAAVLDVSSTLLAAEDGPAAEGEKEKEQNYEVEAILSDRISRGKQQYLVKWVGYTAEHNTWEPAENLSECDLHLATFHKKQSQTKTPSVLNTKKTTPISKPSTSKGKKTAQKNDFSPQKNNFFTQKTVAISGRVVKPRLPELPDDRSSSSASGNGGQAGPSQPDKRRAIAERFNLAVAAIACHAVESDEESEDLPLGASALDHRSSNQHFKDEIGSEEIKLSSPQQQQQTPSQPRNTVSRLLNTSTVKKVILLSSDDEDETDNSPTITSPPPQLKVTRPSGGRMTLDSSDVEEKDKAKSTAVAQTPSSSSKRPTAGKRTLESSDEEDGKKQQSVETPTPRRKRAIAPRKSASVKVDVTKAEAEAEDGEYEVERLIGAVLDEEGTQWGLVFWKGYGLKDCTFEPIDGLGRADWEVKAFYEQYGKPTEKKRRIMTKEGLQFEKKQRTMKRKD